MKKIFLLLALMCMICGQAQKNTFTKSAMVLLVTEAKKTYTKGIDYNNWTAAQIGNTVKPNPEEEKLLRDVYGFLSTNANPETIHKNYEGASLLALAKSKSAPVAFTESNARCGFWCQLEWAIIRYLVEILVETEFP